MKQGIITTIDWSFIGATLANLGDEEQVAFFKSFLKEMGTWETAHQAEMQLAQISKGLTDKEKEVLSMLTFKDGV